ncbi:hypothetical protein BCh11DRAFT_07874 [Burkholderia sp. Ch1-1]|nr:hypothetical protein BCh11DRAFT_07874 [Burkholderia sp. Ch1-1]
MSAEFQSKQLTSRHKRHDDRGRRSGIIGVVFATLFVAVVVLCYLPLSPVFPTDNLDSAWQWVMNEAVARHLVIGRDVIFTFGPFASVDTRQYHPATDMLDMGASLLLGLALATGLLSIATGRRKWPLVAVPTAILLNTTIRDPLFLALPPLLLILTVRIEMRRDSPLALPPSWSTSIPQVLLTASMGILPLIKGSFGLLSIVLGGLCILLQWRSSPAKALVGSVIFVGALVGGWAIAGQPIDAIPRYFLSMRPIISGYTDAMSTRGRYDELVVYVLSAAVLLGSTYFGIARRIKLEGLGLIFGLALVLFVAFKAGFVRHDAHALIAFGTLMFVEIFIAVLCSPRAAVILVALALGGFVFSDNHYMHFRTLPARMSNGVSTIARGIENRINGNASVLAEYSRNLAEMRTSFPLPALPGAWDIYPNSQNILLANNVPWSPRPIFQSYSAYGLELEQLNEAHLLGPSAPDNIQFSVASIDGRLPALEDGMSWLTLINAYSVRGRSGDFAILRKNQVAAPASLKALERVDAAVGQNIAVPAGNAPVWVRLDLVPSFAGRIVNILFAAPEVHIELSFANSRTESYRYIPSMGAAGFLVSPLIRNTDDFTELISLSHDQHFASLRPVSIRIVPQRNSAWLWSVNVSVEFSQVEMPGQR